MEISNSLSVFLFSAKTLSVWGSIAHDSALRMLWLIGSTHVVALLRTADLVKNGHSLHSMIIHGRIKCSIKNVTWVWNSSSRKPFLFCLIVFDILSAKKFFWNFLQHAVIIPDRNSFWRHKYADNSNISGYFTSRELPENVKKVFV